MSICVKRSGRKLFPRQAYHATSRFEPSQPSVMLGIGGH
jgi:hypothetical protein